MSAEFSRCSARLNALLSRFLAGSGVAHRDTFMPSTCQWLITRPTTRDLFHMARHCLPEFMSAVAPSLSQDAARWTCGLAMAVMQHLMVTEVFARTRSITSGSSRTTWYRRINHFGAAFTIQFFKTALQARRTSSYRREKNFILYCPISIIDTIIYLPI
ncbi:hypothetical protein ALC57_17225 [Trachymyrmex cornetzi]|uniref:Uncharacterized protein n=1 Tax=Trachymyrmex cornetzi TaxID=471704 RepID=A0A195DCI3_9HYME|nr:hypothetical protein ALC57_17225 [Trachymyrmex cornetzi]